jgi:predicted PurR-regulated permease PerM
MQKPLLNYILNNHILATVIIIAVGFFLFQVKGILLGLFMAYIIMAAIHPFVRELRKYKVPKILAIALIYSIVVAVFILLVIPVLAVFIQQIQQLFKAFPAYLDTASSTFGIEINRSSINSLVGPLASSAGTNLFSITSRVFGGIFAILSVFVVSFYLLIDRERLGTSVPQMLPEHYREKARLTIHLVEEKLGAWLRGQIILSVVIGLITWVVLYLMNVPYAVPLAILAGFLEIIPTLGPIIAAIPAVIIGFSISPVLGIAVLIAYAAIQVAENNILVPKIMQKAVGLNPIVILVAILIGAELLGVVGALLSIPFVSAAIIIYRSFK